MVGEEIEMMQLTAAPVVVEDSAATQLGLLQALTHEQILQREAMQVVYKEVLPKPNHHFYSSFIYTPLLVLTSPVLACFSFPPGEISF
jgi:hypothetical protein